MNDRGSAFMFARGMQDPICDEVIIRVYFLSSPLKKSCRDHYKISIVTNGTG